jgi:hypothetical protein
MNKYFRIIATHKETGKEEILFGSYDRSDCVYEKDCEKDSWKEEGYKGIRIVSCEVEEEADKEVYETVTSHELWIKHAPSFNFELDQDQLLETALERGFVTKAGEDSYIINPDY